VVDNASTDGSIELVEDRFKWVKLTKLDKNLGFAVANNLALKKIKSRYAMLLNSDVELNIHSNFDLLIDYLDANPQVGVITPKLILTAGQIDPACHRGEPTPWASLTYFAGLEKMFPKIKLFSQYHQYYQDLNSIHAIDACSGAAMIVRAELMKKVGLLDERFFMYAEDLDWCRRFRQNGGSVIYYPIVSLIHHKKKSGLQSQAKDTSRQTNEYFYSTMAQYYDKHYAEHYPGCFNWLIKQVINIKKSTR
jgi:GT2 family glycosyltransferase